MSDWNPSIVMIEKVEKHPNADLLEIVTVMNDYPVVVKSGEYKVGDLASYINIDSIVPDTEQFYFLCPKAYEAYEENGEVKHRQIGPKYELGSVPEHNRTIFAKKIRNVYSQGMLVEAVPGLSIGDSIVEHFSLKKMEEEEEDNIPRIKSLGVNAEKVPSGWSIPHYDIEGARKYIQYLQPNEEIVLTEKCHGCLDYDTLISTLEFGDVKIGDLVSNKLQATIKSVNVITCEVEWKSCSNWFNNGPSDDWYELLSSTGESVKITGNHLVWLAQSSSYKPVAELTENDILTINISDFFTSKIQSITKISNASDRFDITVDDNHNYFANNILVHNSNFSACYDSEEDRLRVKSRNFYKKKSDQDQWWDAAIRLDLEEKLKNYPGLAFFGELVGQVKGFKYACKVSDGFLKTNVLFFDIYNTKTNRYLDYDERVKILDSLSLPRVPELYRGVWDDKDKLYSLAEGKSLVDPSHIREGWVLVTAKERFEPKLQSRMQVKLVGQAYNLLKGK
jgi:tRNA-binding EMAP/Myf-like protein